MADATSTNLNTKSGKHPDKALTAAFVRTVTAAGKYNDGQGLFLKVDPSGAKRWVQRIVIRGKRTEMGIGSASLTTLAEAREIATVNRKLARQGGDPLQAKREAQAVLTFAEDNPVLSKTRITRHQAGIACAGELVPNYN